MPYVNPNELDRLQREAKEANERAARAEQRLKSVVLRRPVRIERKAAISECTYSNPYRGGGYISLLLEGGGKLSASLYSGDDIEGLLQQLDDPYTRCRVFIEVGG